MISLLGDQSGECAVPGVTLLVRSVASIAHGLLCGLGDVIVAGRLTQESLLQREGRYSEGSEERWPSLDSSYTLPHGRTRTLTLSLQFLSFALSHCRLHGRPVIYFSLCCVSTDRGIRRERRDASAHPGPTAR